MYVPSFSDLKIQGNKNQKEKKTYAHIYLPSSALFICHTLLIFHGEILNVLNIRCTKSIVFPSQKSKNCRLPINIAVSSLTNKLIPNPSRMFQLSSINFILRKETSFARMGNLHKVSYLEVNILTFYRISC